MSTNLPDFTIIERTIERRLLEINLSPKLIPEGIDTGYNKFEIRRLETQAVTFDTKNDAATKTYLASSEILAILEHPSFGSAQVKDLVTLHGNSLEGALERCANTYVDVTFPALQSLFEGKSAPGSDSMKMVSAPVKSGNPITWEVYTGQLQILNDDDGWLADRLKQKPPIALMLDTLTGFLSKPQLHWCKLFGKARAKDVVDFGCSIDGYKLPQAEAEMKRKFGDAGEEARHWEFRQFLVMRPTDKVDEAMVEALNQKAQEVADQDRSKGWFSRLMGRKS